jgi:carbohydrate-selective porin OprB
VPHEWFGHGKPWREWSRMTGDWDTARTALENRGVTLSLSQIGDASALATGGSRPRPVGRGLFDASVEMDFERLMGWRGTTVKLQYLKKGGGLGSDCASEAQGFSNIDADDFSGNGEVWVEQQFGSFARLKAGRIDANTEFAFVENGAEFINSSMGFTPTISLLPTYPDPHAGIVLQVTPSARTYVGGGLFNAGPAVAVGDFDARFGIGEAGVRWTARGGGRLGVGYWHAGGLAAAEDGTRSRLSTGGGYVVFDQALWSGDARALAMFAQLGASDARFSPVSRHAAVGFTASGFVPSRAQDVIGVAVTGVRFGDTARCDESRLGTLAEMNVGAFYKLQLSPWLALKPDLQFVVHPRGAPTPSMLVGTLRVEVGF